MIHMKPSVLFYSLLFISSFCFAADKDNKNKAAQKSDQTAPIWATPESGDQSALRLKPHNGAAEPGKEWQHPNKIQFLIGGVYSTGGDSIKEIAILFNNDPGRNIYPGDNIFVYFGALIPIPDTHIRTQVALGYSRSYIDGTATSGESADVSFTRMPLDIIPMIEFEKHSIGLGISIHLKGKLEGGTSSQKRSLNFENSLASIISYRYHLRPNLSFGIRYTDVDYRPKKDRPNSRITTTDAAQIGLQAQFRF